MPLITGGGGNAGREAIWNALEKLAAEQRKANPRLTLEQARAAAYSTPAGKTYLERWRTAKADVTPEQVEKQQRAPLASAKIDAAAVALQKADSSLTIEKARALAMERDPGLLRAFRQEQAGGPVLIIGAPADESEWCRSLQISKSENTIAELAEARLVELTKSELARNQQLVKLDPTVKSLTTEGAFVVAVNTREGREAYEQMRRPDSHLTPAQARQAAVDRLEKSVTDALAEMRKRDPIGYAAAFGPTAAPAIAAPQPAAVTKWQPYGQPAQGERTWVAKSDGGSLQLRLLEPGGRDHQGNVLTAEGIRKAWSAGMLELDPGSVASWYFGQATTFLGREIPAGSVVSARPAA